MAAASLQKCAAASAGNFQHAVDSPACSLRSTCFFPGKKCDGLLKLVVQKRCKQKQERGRRPAGRASASAEDASSGTGSFCKVEAIVRPWRLTLVAAALLRSGIRGVTVSEVRGFGAQGGSRERQAGSEFTEDSFVSKVKLEIVVSEDQVQAVVDTIIQEARTGEIGDGKIWITPVSDIIRIRTGERGIDAERMAGGRAELLSSQF